MAMTNGFGQNEAFFCDYYERHSIASEDFSPSEDASLTAEEIGRYMEKGFLVRPNLDGDLYGITWYDYQNNIDPITKLPTVHGNGVDLAAIAEPFDGIANQWIECRFVAVLATSTATSITVGIKI